ncbi:TROVE domain-containing protein [Mycobacterium sp. CBMA293]|uniref:TROVE domain-containing protein n=1 Tax=unclassified Mycolicibacterium TaxID=2636767 RepID=UPI0012DC872E|nr:MULTISPECIES: TROVE domain-containing protein [unclassified Mycolicibacterium]MUL47624.1 TROVE domain-containing protein [Mycolicibacterium sp. CBMA 360]MUL61858.1 TROVE domain-containing protein [Mycolicibacterium sp. CBMA 335]MUL68931.1 TROVE domain-containing protein [Mycolicibacterium sp. CBMA 311]MUL92852.1 TROVE domain-containing protein [Mycolicibacterium sp. CBMA 230]MUM08705.1 RNA-binding protein [Mycolicibacterium sp. CBMA 213]
MDVLTTVNTRRTAQTVQADPRQVKNSAGGYTFAIDDWARVHRFLTLGTDGGTYYTSAADLTKDNAAAIFRAAADNPLELVRRIVDVSANGRAPKQNPALFALAVAAACDDVDGRRAALAALPQVARTGTHLFTFAKYVEQFRGWGPALAKGVARWYTDKPVDKLAYQLVKYRQREDWTHRDLLRLSHPVTAEPGRRALFDYVTRGVVGHDPETFREGDVIPALLPAIVEDFVEAQNTAFVSDWVDIIQRGNGLSWEMLPDAALSSPSVWEALVYQGIPQTALMRQLPRLTRLGLATGTTAAVIADQLQDAERLKRGRVHPINVLVALRTYAAGRSARGDGTWTPASKITDALDAAFYNAYGAVEPSGKRTLLALDVSGSMATSSISGMPLTPREASAALAMVTAASEPDCEIVGFTGRHEVRGTGWNRQAYVAENIISRLDISPRRRLDDVCRYVGEQPLGWTDCALPFTWAMREGLVFDTVVILTDNESFAGPVHVHQALKQYRERVNPAARLAVVSMTGTQHSIADPSDTGSLDVSGFDGAVPQLLADFSRGDI